VLDLGLSPSYIAVVKSPRWSLRVIKNLAAKGSIRVTDSRAAAFFGGDRVATAQAAMTAIAALTARDFAQTIMQADICDVYGIIRDEQGWYLKVTVIHPELVVVSLHPLDRPLRTNGGVVEP
jgi:hypothetical protein